MHVSSNKDQSYDAGRGRSSSAFRESDRDHRGGNAWNTPFRGGRGGMAHSMEQDKEAAIATTRY